LKKNLVLTGMMGVGKSTIGRKLSEKLKLKFIDIDQFIEKREKSKISEIFKVKGEIYFRKIEKKITLEILKEQQIVIALGGGSFLNNLIRQKIKNSSLSFWLDSNIKIILPRLQNIKKRPLLNKDNFEENINKIYLERKKIYNKADFKIKCDSLEIDEIVNKIIKLYENSTN
tara:strand:- start:1767 stop:2282 length:516 start_codon:yes stop_codon:yes gene_type:complete